MIRFEREACRILNDALTREWLETNGLGGYASSTIVGLNTRRYHGLLVAATKPPVGRLVMLSKLEETLIVDGRRYDLSANQYPGAIHPRGFQSQTGFRLDPFPIFTYEVEDIIIEKSVFMVHGENTTVIQYELKHAPSDSSLIPRRSSLHHRSSLYLELRPLIAFRDYHSLAHEKAALNREALTENHLAIVKPDAELPSLYFAHEADELDASASDWYRSFEYERERERGFDFAEDLFNPFVLRFDLNRRERVDVIASTERHDVRHANEFRQKEIERRQKLIASAVSKDEFVGMLTLAADQYLVARGDNQTVIAGYHWFSDWGRDTMIALHGLTLSTGRYDVARSILTEFAKFVDRGMLPNRFPDAGAEPEYNTVDATLWFFEAVRALVEHTADYDFVRTHLYNVLVEIIEWHVRGTRYNIRVEANGLLTSGEEGVQLTWMDAKVGDWVVTPRRGLAVEIQALWYNALRIMEDLAGKFDEQAAQAKYALMAEGARASFNELFWNEEAGCLYDVIDGETRDASIRPNQIFAVSLHHSMLTLERARRVVDVVQRELLTPVGLRSLSPNDSQYRGSYQGDSLSRDGAYHQGTVWAWLMGAFINAYLKAFGETEATRAQVSGWLAPFQVHLNEAGLGHISEIFDGDAPHTPRGCVAQAWSVAELLRCASVSMRKIS
jgi:predicted glycogen debranching enzyme